MIRRDNPVCIWPVGKPAASDHGDGCAIACAQLRRGSIIATIITTVISAVVAGDIIGMELAALASYLESLALRASSRAGYLSRWRIQTPRSLRPLHYGALAVWTVGDPDGMRGCHPASGGADRSVGGGGRDDDAESDAGTACGGVDSGGGPVVAGGEGGSDRGAARLTAWSSARERSSQGTALATDRAASRRSCVVPHEKQSGKGARGVRCSPRAAAALRTSTSGGIGESTPAIASVPGHASRAFRHCADARGVRCSL